MKCHRGTCWCIPKNHAWLAIGNIMDYTGLLEEFDWVCPGVLTIPNAEDRRVGWQPIIARRAAVHRILLDSVRQFNRFILVVHPISDGCWKSLYPEAPVRY